MSSQTPSARRFLLLLAVLASCNYDSTGYNAPSPDLNEGLWLGSGSTPAILRVSPAQLLTSGRAFAATIITTPSADLLTLNSIAFDATGTMWVASESDSRLLAFPPAALGTSGSRTASVVIASANQSLTGPAGIAFDRQHRLWVANFGAGTLVRFDPAQLAASGAPAPGVVLGGLGQPAALAFDAAGSLWVSDIQAHRLVKYSPAQLAASGSPVPAVVLSLANGSSTNGSGIAFDAAGNLWVANVGDQIIGAFSPAQLAATGSPLPHVLIGTNFGTLRVPTGVSFDAAGSMWVMTLDGGLEKYTSAQIAASGTPAPTVALQVNDHTAAWGVAFWPKPAGLPLN